MIGHEQPSQAEAAGMAVVGIRMSELQQASRHLRRCQERLARFRLLGWSTWMEEDSVLAALSWVWFEQETERLMPSGRYYIRSETLA